MKKLCQKKSGRYYIEYLLLYSVCFALVMAGVLYTFWNNGKSLVWQVDGLSLYAPKAYYFMSSVRKILGNLFQGVFSVPLYSFVFGMGDTVPIPLEPIYWLLLLFSPDNLELAFSVVFIVRFYAAGLAMSAFLLYFKNGRLTSLIGSYAYIICGFTLESGFRHPQFLAPMIFLPLGILCVEEIYRKKRWYLLTIFAAVHLWYGYYFLYMNTIAMGIYFLIRFLGNKEGRNVKEFFLRMRTIIGSYLLGILIGNFTFLNTFASYLSSSRAGTSSETVQSLSEYLWYVNEDRLLKFWRYFMAAGRSNGKGMILGFIPLIYLAVVALFLKKKRGQLKAAFIIGTAFCFIPAASFVFSGFASFTYRWSYIYAFVLAAILAFVLKDLCSMSLIKQAVLCLATVPFWYTHMVDYIDYGKKTERITSASCLALGISLVVIFIVSNFRFSWKKKQILLLGTVIFSTWNLAWQQFDPSTGKLVSEFLNRGNVLTELTDTPMNATTEIDDDSFYRVATKETNFSIRGTAQVLQYNSTVYDCNTMPGIWQEFYREMGLVHWTKVRMRGFDGRSFLDTLASVKYFMVDDEKEFQVPYGYQEEKTVEKDGNVYQIFKKENALPIGYTYDKVISEEEFLQYDTPQRQEVMMQAAVLEDCEETENQVDITGFPLTCTNIEYDDVTIEGNQVTVQASDEDVASITFSFDAPENSEIYLYFDELLWDSGRNEKIGYRCDQYTGYYRIRGMQDSYFTGQSEYLLFCGYHEEKTSSLQVKFYGNMKFHCDAIKIYCQPMEAADGYVDQLKEEALENVEMLDDQVKGTIHLEKEKVLVFSIPYDKGWKAYVDGKETELVKANMMYMGILMEPGEHTVELYYQIPGLKISILLSLAGVAIFAVALMIRRKKRNASQHSNTVL